ncbi:hypothetical protein PQX77_015240 [Marasmius sp. AFHP31]|nr:hypothetical protein PQX77_015240 [Marasmius sp. AFHP31]
MIVLFSWYLLAQLILTVWGEELSVPSSWVKSTVEASREERINRTAEAIDAFIASDALFTSTQPPSNLSDQYWPYGEFLALIADFDIITNQTRYKQIVQERFLPALQRTTLDTVIVSTLIGSKLRYGYAATRAYLAYQDEGFLTIAKDYWASTKSFTLSDEDVQSRSSPAKSKINSNVSLSCSKPGSEYTLAGGTFHSTAQNDLFITTGTTADYLTFTVSLATVPSNLDPAYMILASQTGQFMRNTLQRGSVFFYSGVTPGDPDCPSRKNTSDAPVSDTGVTMKALSLLTLSAKNDDYTDVLSELVRRVRTWNSVDGVLDPEKFPRIENQTIETQTLVRSFFDIASSNGTSDLKVYLRAYLAVQASALSSCIICPRSDQQYGDQYSALSKLATFPSGVPNLYGPGLIPSKGKLDPEAQTLAITTLLGGVISSDSDREAPNDPRTTDATTPDTSSRSRLPIGAIVGGVVGGILGIVSVAVGSYCCLRRRRQLQSSLSTVEPYLAMSSSRMTPPPLSTVLPFRSGKYEKTTVLASPNISESTSSEPSILTPPGATQLGPQSSRMPREATTAELVTLLNQRLGLEPRDVNAEQWEESQSPPDYSSQPGGGRT